MTCFANLCIGCKDLVAACLGIAELHSTCWMGFVSGEGPQLQGLETIFTKLGPVLLFLLCGLS